MNTNNSTTDIIMIIGIVIAIIEVAFLIYKNHVDNLNKKRRATIVFYNSIYEKTSELKDLFYDKTKNKKFVCEEIINSDELTKYVMDYLTYFESFSVGVKLNVYDYEVFIKMTSEDLCRNLYDLIEYIKHGRKIMNYSLLFDESYELIKHIRYVQDCKTRNKKISKKMILKSIL
jgi:hypothetical protein